MGNERSKRVTYDTGGTGGEGESRNKPTSRGREGGRGDSSGKSKDKIEKTAGKTRSGIWGALTNTK